MAELRSLKLALLADTTDFIQGLDKANKEAKTFSQKLDAAVFGAAKAFAAAGAAAGAMAISIGVDAVKAAIEDEKAQATLAQTLKNTTKATKDQIKGVEDYIDKTQRATGITDDQLRPSLDRLVRSTKDITKAQQLQQLALNISAGTGKDLATVTEGLGKAYDGNLGALKRLGIPLSESIVKSKDFDAAVKELSKTFEGQADIAANTFEGRMARIKIAIDEAKESLGQALLPILERFADFATTSLVPALEGFIDGLTGKDGVKKAIYDTGTGLVTFVDDLNNVRGSGFLLGSAVRDLGKAFAEFNNIAFGTAGAESGLKKLLDLLTDFIKAAETAISLYDKVRNIPVLGNVPQLAVNPIGSTSRLVNPKPLTTTVTNIYNYVKGALDPQGVAREIVKVTNTATRTTGLRAFAN